ncbi:MAG TPA: VOC family protein [Dehalococcoidia bacterium]|nr:VOC family protein [Dehalococcoidia bacterium]
MTDSWVKGLFAVTLFVDDLAESKRFYQDVFEMPILNEDASSCAFRFRGVVINVLAATAASELIEPAPVGERGTPARMMLTLEVDDVDSAAERLRTVGVELLNGPMDRPWGPRTVTFADPSGHCWELSS